MIPMFNRGRTTRLTVALLIATSLLAMSFATTFAALANVTVGGGNLTGAYPFSKDTGTGATPTTVSPGKVAGFYLWAVNDDTANLSSFFLTASTTATVKGAYWKHPADASWQPCDISNGLKCSFGAFNSTVGVQVVAAFTLPTSTSTSSTNCLPTGGNGIAADSAVSHVCVDFQFSSNSGYVPGKNKSRGDAYHWYDVVYTNTGTDQAAQFPFCDLSSTAACDSNLLTINDTKANFGKNNAQWTQVQAPQGAFNSAHASSAIGVADNFPFDCAGITGFTADCAAADLAQWSQVDVNSGQDFSPAFIKVDVGIYGVGANKISTVYHFYELSGVWNVEVIGTKCPTSAGPTGSSPCFWVTSLGGNSSQVSIWTHFNGKFGIG